MPAKLSRALDHALDSLKERSADVDAATVDVRERLHKLMEAEAELAAREKSFTEKSDRMRVEQRRLADRERGLAQFHRDLLDPDALDTQWVAQRDRSFAEAESLLEERRRELDTREQELDEHQIRQTARLESCAASSSSARASSPSSGRLERREQELNAYVAQLQRGMA